MSGLFALPRGFMGRVILRGMNRFHMPMIDWALSHVAWQPGWNVLDIGCGGGANIARLLDLCPEGRADGIDLSEESVAFARRRNRDALGKRCTIRRGDVLAMPYDDGSYDAATAFETVYFWPDLPAALSEVHRILRPEGILLIGCEASDPGNGMWAGRIEGMHVYSPEELERMLRDAGFGDTSVYRNRREIVCIVARRQ